MTCRLIWFIICGAILLMVGVALMLMLLACVTICLHACLPARLLGCLILGCMVACLFACLNQRSQPPELSCSKLMRFLFRSWKRNAPPVKGFPAFGSPEPLHPVGCPPKAFRLQGSTIKPLHLGAALPAPCSGFAF